MKRNNYLQKSEDEFNYTILPYVIADERKSKFLPYVRCEEFYKLDYNLMNKAIAIISAKAVLQRNIVMVSLCNDNIYNYYYLIIDDGYKFSIIHVEGIEEIVEEKNGRYRNIK